MRFRSIPFILTLAAVAAVAGSGANGETPAPPHLPAGVSPLAPARARHVAELMREAETYRGLKA